MAKIFDIYLAKADQPESDAYAELSLPATPYQIQDVFDKLRLAEGEELYWEITEYHSFEELSSVLDESCGLYDLNALAQKFSELNEQQSTAFAGLLQMEQVKDEPIHISRLIDLAYSTDCCHVVGEALNDSQLGRFCAENGFVPGVEELPDAVFDLLNFEQIGREHRLGEGGVLVERTADHPGGYVLQHTELVEAYDALNLTPEQPDYAILLETEDGAQWKLPSASLPEGRYTCLDCMVPDLTGAISDAEDISSIQRVAEKLTDIGPKELAAYKALLSVTDSYDLNRAEQLMDTLDQYIFSPQFSSPIEIARGELSVILAEPEAEMIAPHLNLYQYGQALLHKCGGVLTDYGLIERKDHQPVQVMEDQFQRGGMEMK